jgi:hypothetical protein
MWDTVLVLGGGPTPLGDLFQPPRHTLHQRPEVDCELTDAKAIHSLKSCSRNFILSRMVFPLCYIVRHIARQRNLPQVTGVHRVGEIMLDRPAQLSRANCRTLARK